MAIPTPLPTPQNGGRSELGGRDSPECEEGEREREGGREARNASIFADGGVGPRCKAYAAAKAC